MSVHSPAPRLKYRNRPTGGYSSAKESRRAAELALMQKAGLIRNLEEQVVFVLIPAQYINARLVERSTKYISDFVYEEPATVGAHPNGPWRKVVEDVKSEASKTKEYRIKRKLMLLVHGIRIRET